MERKVERVERSKGGEGYVLMERLIGEDVLDGKCRMFANIVLEKDCSLGFHAHHGESETYYILEGSGIYNDTGNEIPVSAGDVLVCRAGNGHGLKNQNQEPLRYVALVING